MTQSAGRDAVFRGKDRTLRYQGIVTTEGARLLEQARAELARLFKSITGKEVAVSDGDVFEYLARGRTETRRVLTERAKS